MHHQLWRLDGDSSDVAQLTHRYSLALQVDPAQTQPSLHTRACAVLWTTIDSAAAPRVGGMVGGLATARQQEGAARTTRMGIINLSPDNDCTRDNKPGPPGGIT